MNALVPYRQYLPYDYEETERQMMLGQLALTRPWRTEGVLKREIEAREASNRLVALQSVSRDHTAGVCAWLSHRKDGETEITLETDSFAGAPGGWFSSGSHERLRMRTRVTIK